MTLGNRLQSRENGVVSVRFILAILVLIYHVPPISSLKFDSVVKPVTDVIGSIAVDSFFVLSGYLITLSAIRTPSIRSYAAKRLLRIVPGFWTVLVVTIFVFAPLISTLTKNMLPSAEQGVHYFFGNFLLLIKDHSMSGVTSMLPYPLSINGSLWTLLPELACYAGIIVAVKIIPRYFLSSAVLVTFFTVCLATNFLSGHIQRLSELLMFFLIGALFLIFGGRIKVSPLLCTFSLIILVVVYSAKTPIFVTGVFLGYFVLAMGSLMPKPSWLRNRDYSYGLYLYAFPVSQALVALSQKYLIEINLIQFILLSTTTTLGFAIASWHFVESPMLKLARRI